MKTPGSVEQVLQLQQKKLHDLLHFVLENSAFYRELYRSHGITQANLKGIHVSDLPFISKRMLKDNFDDAVTDSRLRKSALEVWIQNNLDPRQPFHSDFIAVHSSGSSGETGIFVYDRVGWQIMTSKMAERLPSPEAFPKKTRVAFCIAAYGNFTGITTALQLSPVFDVMIVSAYESPEHAARLLNRFQPHRLIGYPENISELAKMTMDGELNIKPSTVFLSGTAATPAMLSNMFEAWSPEIRELYMASESIFVGLKKARQKEMVLMDDLNIVEILDKDHRAVAPGGYGRVLLTNLYNHALPIIRYELRDYVIGGGRDPESGFSTVAKLVGRTDDLLPVVSIDGTIGNIESGSLLAFAHTEFEKIQFVSCSEKQVRIDYVAKHSLDNAIANAFKQLLEEQNGNGTSFEVRRVADIALDSETGKIRLVRSEKAQLGSTSEAIAERTPSVAQKQAALSPNNSFEPFPREALKNSVSGRFGEIAKKYSQRPAVKIEKIVTSYEALDTESDRTVAALSAECSTQSRVIGICLGKDSHLISAILGVLKAGLSYTCLDPSSTSLANVIRVLNDAQPALVLTNSAYLSLANKIVQDHCRIINIDHFAPEQIDGRNRAFPILPDSVAYLLYSSGSTGGPKGIMHTQESLLHACMMNTNAFYISAEDRIGFVNSVTFNPCVRDIFGAVLNGACLFPFDIHVRGFDSIAEWLEADEITILSTVPTIFRQIVKTIRHQSFPALRVIELIGELSDRNDLELYRRYFPESCVLVNSLGSSECHVLARFMMNHDTKVSTHRLPCGFSTDDKDIYLVDSNGEEIGSNRAGEIAVESSYLARGYWRQPDLTRQRFVPVENSDSKIRFLTGDLGVKVQNGLLYHLGRLDAQIKIRGLTVDREEVQRAVRDVPGIGEVVVGASRDDAGNATLAAYYTVTGTPGPDIEEIRTRLAGVLPHHMIPSSYVPVKMIPKTETGKLDIKAFTNSNAFLIPPVQQQAIDAPRSRTEEDLVRIWREVLNVEAVGIHQSFLDVGGHSLTAMQLVNRIRERLGVEVSLRDFLDHLTIASIATLVDAERNEKAATFRGGSGQTRE